MSADPAHLWSPNYGDRFNLYLHRLAFLDDAGRNRLKQETRRILSRTFPPRDDEGSAAVLVVGEVQSGKTASFTGLMALALDNGFRVVVVLAGTKKPLLKQTTGRLAQDLALQPRDMEAECLLINSPIKRDYSLICARVASDPPAPLIITTLKTAPSIRRVTALIKQLRSLISHLPVLIIDDEGDQAGLNVAHRQGSESATYAAIVQLRTAAPNHSYVFYTATPQANLLIDIQDRLAPDSVVVMESADSYVGGSDLFGVGATFYRPVPLAEIPTATNPTPTDDPPKSLAESFAFFLICMAYVRKCQPELLPLSMLVHPHSTMATHDRYQKWLNSIISSWRFLLEDENAATLVLNQFLAPARIELARTISATRILESGLSDDTVLCEQTLWALDAVRLRVLNSDRTWRDDQEIQWQSSPGWIIIGGQKLERGFTLENLIVTYMPRGIGANTADTIQQRGRFFGHKRHYLELLRGWLNPDTRDSFRSIVEHEDLYRTELRKVDQSGEALGLWVRKFLLEPSMSPTRQLVISLPHRRYNFAPGWRFKQERLYDPALPLLQDLVEMTVLSWQSQSSSFGKDRRLVDEAAKHHVVPVDMSNLLETLWSWPMHRTDREEFEILLQGLAAFAQRQNHLDAHVILMSNLQVRIRSSDSHSRGPHERDWQVDNLHQGRSANYLGDREMKTDDALTVQIHRVSPRLDRQDTSPRSPVLALAIAWPLGFNRAMLLQTNA